MNRRSSILRSFGLIASAITVPKLSAFAEASTSKKSFRIAHITDVHMMPLI